jgi:hypothetical protein
MSRQIPSLLRVNNIPASLGRLEIAGTASLKYEQRTALPLPIVHGRLTIAYATGGLAIAGRRRWPKNWGTLARAILGTFAD